MRRGLCINLHCVGGGEAEMGERASATDNNAEVRQGPIC